MWLLHCCLLYIYFYVIVTTGLYSCSQPESLCSIACINDNETLWCPDSRSLWFITLVVSKCLSPDIRSTLLTRYCYRRFNTNGVSENNIAYNLPSCCFILLLAPVLIVQKNNACFRCTQWMHLTSCELSLWLTGNATMAFVCHGWKHFSLNQIELSLANVGCFPLYRLSVSKAII